MRDFDTSGEWPSCPNGFDTSMRKMDYFDADAPDVYYPTIEDIIREHSGIADSGSALGRIIDIENYRLKHKDP